MARFLKPKVLENKHISPILKYFILPVLVIATPVVLAFGWRVAHDEYVEKNDLISHYLRKDEAVNLYFKIEDTHDYQIMLGEHNVIKSQMSEIVVTVREMNATMLEFIRAYSQANRCYYDDSGKLICPKSTKAAIHNLEPNQEGL